VLTSAGYNEALLYSLIGVYASDMANNKYDISNLKIVSGYIIKELGLNDKDE
jgi:hypothetical protein